MNKKLLIGAIAAIVLVSAAAGVYFLSPSKKAKPEKIYHVGILSGLDLFIGIADSFKAEMAARGYIEGKNIVYDFQKTNYEPEKEKQILQKFVADKVDLIFGFNTEVALAAKAAASGTDIPVVFANAFAEENNLVESIPVPGGNITGVRYPGIDVAVKRLEILHEIAPAAKRIWVPYQKDYPSVPPILKVLRQAVASLGVDLIEFPSENITALDNELKRRAASGSLGFDAVLFLPESLSTSKDAFAIIAKYTRERKIPIGGSSIATADYGTLFAVTVDSVEIGKLAASLADKVFQGVPAGSISVVSPETILVLNYKVASELGLKLDNNLLGEAGKIIR